MANPLSVFLSFLLILSSLSVMMGGCGINLGAEPYDDGDVPRCASKEDCPAGQECALLPNGGGLACFDPNGGDGNTNNSSNNSNNAQCQSDSDCSGDLVCRVGRCDYPNNGGQSGGSHSDQTQGDSTVDIGNTDGELVVEFRVLDGIRRDFDMYGGFITVCSGASDFDAQVNDKWSLLGSASGHTTVRLHTKVEPGAKLLRFSITAKNGQWLDWGCEGHDSQQTFGNLRATLNGRELPMETFGLTWCEVGGSVSGCGNMFKIDNSCGAVPDSIDVTRFGTCGGN